MMCEIELKLAAKVIPLPCNDCINMTKSMYIFTKLRRAIVISYYGEIIKGTKILQNVMQAMPYKI